jgi:tetratricopeptide (TPR) repeat protein
VRAPLVGRERELRQVLDAFDRALADRSCRLFTVLGVAGVGKSRLVAEVIDALRGGGTVAVGRCLPYGDGLTWWPLAEALGTNELLERVAVDEPAVSRAVELLKPTVGRVARDEAFWVMRKALQALARRRPTLLVVDDLQWADSTFMDFLDHVVSWEHDAPLLLLVMARPELRDARPRWGEGRPNAGSALLEPLAEAEAGELLEHLLGPARLSTGTAARILDVAAGNPLFVVEVVAMLSDEGVLPWRDPRGVAEPAAIAVPLTIQALLAARLDRLGEDERTLIEAASIEGKHFTRDAVAALVGDGDGQTIGIQLHALVRKGLIRAEGSGDERFRFDHQLIRDAAYDGMSKERRADLHEWFASWLQAHGSAVLGSGELVGYHLERAVGLRRELGETGAITAQLAARASSNLSAAGHRAAQRDDHAAAIALFERAIALVDSDDAARGALLPALGTSLFEAGRMAEATRVLEEAIAGAPEPWLEARARIEREFVRLELETGVGAESARRLVDEVLPVLERARDDHGQCRAWSLRAHAAWQSGRVERADADWVQAVACARRADDGRELFATLGWRATAAVLGPTPVDEAIGRCEEIRGFVRSTPVTLAWALNPLALLHAMRGQFELAARFLHRANEILHELGSLHSSAPHLEALVRLLAGEPKLAEVALRAGVDRLASMNSLGLLATTNAILAHAVYAQGRMQEADELCRRASDAAAADDIFTQVIWRGVKAKILAGQGRCNDALALAGEAVALATPTDLLTLRGDALLDLAVGLRACAPESQSRCATRGALSLYERKGNRVAAARARSLLSTR